MAPVRRDHLGSIIYLLKDILEHEPAEQDLSSICKKFITQPHLYGWAFFLNTDEIFKLRNDYA